MIAEEEGETRLQYLSRVLIEYMAEYGDHTIEYDGTECDGECLAEDIASAVAVLPVKGEIAEFQVEGCLRPDAEALRRALFGSKEDK